MEEIAEKYHEVSKRIAQAASKSGRSADSIQLLVVTKFQSNENIQAVIQAGARELGENYPEETHKKIAEMGTEVANVHWHMIGHLQSRKIKYVISDFSMIHSIDGNDIAVDLSEKLGAAGKHMDALFEVNVSGEESKHGYAAWNSEQWMALADNFAALQAQAPSLHFVGLMTMPPYAQKAEDSRVYFEKCRKLSDFIRQHNRTDEFRHLSMGTSLDYEVAIAEGATFVRVGEAIMGPRLCRLQ